MLLQDSFYPATLNGWIGLFISLTVVASTIGGILYRFAIKPLEDMVKALSAATDVKINGQTQHFESRFANHGERIGHSEGQIGRTWERVEALERRADVSEAHRGEMEKDLGRINTRLDSIAEQSTVNKTEIIAFVQSRFDAMMGTVQNHSEAMRQAVHELDKRMAGILAVDEDRRRREPRG